MYVVSLAISGCGRGVCVFMRVCGMCVFMHICVYVVSIMVSHGIHLILIYFVANLKHNFTKVNAKSY